jgi:glycosyltransferase involved in cell wall biosynthesis
VSEERVEADAAGAGGPRVLVVMPAYNAGRTLVDTWGAIPPDLVDEVLLVDDGSRDDTLRVAAGLPIRTIALPHNVGYGGNQKTCYLEALRLGAEVIVMVHPDGQYDPGLLPQLVAPVLAGEADLVLGSRMLIPGGARAGGMPRYRYVTNKALTAIENVMLGTH